MEIYGNTLCISHAELTDGILSQSNYGNIFYIAKSLYTFLNSHA